MTPFGLVFMCLGLVARGLALQNLVETLKANNATTLVSLIDQAGLTNTLALGDGPFTILAPTDAAFAKIPAADLQSVTGDVKALTNILLYHVSNGETFLWDLKTGRFLTSLNGHMVRVYSTAGHHLYFNNAEAIKTEIQATNGVIYLIDEVLDVPEGTILQILKNPAYNLTQFAQLVHAAREDAIFNTSGGSQRLTVFVPNNDAFGALSPDFLHTASTYINARNLADYHTHVGTMHASSLSGKDGHITTKYSGHQITLTHDQGSGEPLLNKLARFTLTDIEAEDGVVHVISHVLIPSSLAPIVG
ncbi:periostin-like [Dreissena polymorpha]|uniref:periostin-like n=1 Tax=Dreissena polymorpha TaxID=45954 RepID=UPI0022651BA1|nr:periostin-like [Dreissena polymorpha]